MRVHIIGNAGSRAMMYRANQCIRCSVSKELPRRPARNRKNVSVASRAAGVWQRNANKTNMQPKTRPYQRLRRLPAKLISDMILHDQRPPIHARFSKNSFIGMAPLAWCSQTSIVTRLLIQGNSSFNCIELLYAHSSIFHTGEAKTKNTYRKKGPITSGDGSFSRYMWQKLVLAGVIEVASHKIFVLENFFCFEKARYFNQSGLQ